MLCCQPVLSGGCSFRLFCLSLRFTIFTPLKDIKDHNKLLGIATIISGETKAAYSEYIIAKKARTIATQADKIPDINPK